MSTHPHILLTPDTDRAAANVADLRAVIETPGISGHLWQSVRAVADAGIDAVPITSFDPLPGRAAEDVRRGNRDYVIVDAAGQRVTCCALASLLTDERSYVDAALRQMESLFDASQWHEWQDIFHRDRFGLDADLRTGQLSRDLALAWDWMYPLLSVDERAWVVDGIDRCGIRPYLRAVEAGAWWMQRMNNWTTVIVGGLGMCGMALGKAHDESDHLVDLSREVMVQYMDHYGPDGEFNENPSYANSSFLPVLYFSALRCHDNTRDIPEPIAALRQHAYWCMYATAPPGHLVSFGDGGPAYPALTSYVPAVAAATADPILQWFYHQYYEPARFPVWELLWYDSGLTPQAPTPETLALGRAYDAHSGLISSRTDWNPRTTPCVVFSKAGHGGVNHTHPDAGQVEIQGHGEPLIVDLGSVPYPADKSGQYYHFNSDGHNLLSFSGRGQIWEPDGSRRARRMAEAFDNDRGGWWRLDLTDVHDGADVVTRTVVHLLPGIVVVMDSARLQGSETCRLRWHPVSEPELSAPGLLSVAAPGARVQAWIGLVDGTPLRLTPGRHEYVPPYDRDRMNNLLPQRHEPYVDASVDSQQVHFISLFAVSAESDAIQAWQLTDSTWTWGDVVVRLGQGQLQVVSPDRRWDVPLHGSEL